MYSNLVPFQDLIDALKDETNIGNLRNLYPKIRRLVYRTQRDIGYGETVMLKRIKYAVEDGTIIVDTQGNRKIRLPEDIIQIEEYGMCQENLCPGDYIRQGNWLFLCTEVESFHLIYWTMLCDGFGFPVISENNFEAVNAGVQYYMYKPKMWNKEGNMNWYQELKQLFYDNVGLAIGNNVFPSTEKEWSQIADRLKMSYLDALVYLQGDKCYCCVPLSTNPTSEEVNETESIVYYWQYKDLTSDISLAPAIDLDYLELQNQAPLQVFTDGVIVPYNNVGRIAFAIRNITENQYAINDTFDQDITDVVFDKYYNSTLQTQIFISKEFYAPGNIFFKLIEN